MVFSCPNPLKSLGCLLILALALRAGAADQSAAHLPISLDAASSAVDYKNNTAVFTDVIISQGDIRIEAKHAETQATGLNFNTGHFTFTGDVRIHVEKRGSLHSDEAVIDFRNNLIVKATITGKPAEFEQKRADSNQTAHGHANEIVYQPDDGVVRLSEDAWLSDGRTDIRGPLLVYNIRQQSIQADTKPGGAERVRITIVPGQEERIKAK